MGDSGAMSSGDCKERPLLPIEPRAFTPDPGNVSPGDGTPACKVHPEHVGKTGLRVAVSSVVLSVLGAGQLTLPYALSQLGLSFGLACLVAFTLLSVYSCHTLSVHAVSLQATPSHCLYSYQEMVVEAVGSAGKEICRAMIVIYSWGGGVGFLVILKGELAFLAESVFGLPGTVFGLDTGVLLMLLVSGCVIWPLSSLKCTSSLKMFAPLACGAAISITAVVAACVPWGEEPCHGPADAVPGSVRRGSLKQVPDSLADVAAALPLLAFALNSSWSYIPILCTLSDKTGARIWSLLVSANTVILLSYLVLSSCGYFMFCGDTDANILDSMGKSVYSDSFKGLAVRLARAALAFQLSIGTPGRFWNARSTLGGRELALLPRCCMSGALAGSAAVLAALPLSLNTVLGLVSSICASMIIYILPAVIDLKRAGVVPGAGRNACSVLSLLVGLFVMCSGLWANVTGVAKGS